MHANGYDLGRNAREVFRFYDACVEAARERPVSVHVCRLHPEAGLAIFGQTADVCRVNPNVRTGYSEGTPGETPALTVERMMRYAYRSVRPMPVHCILDSRDMAEPQRVSSAKEFLCRSVTAVAGGARGVLYRHTTLEDVSTSELSAVIRRFNATLRALHDDLAVAAPAPWVTAAPGEGISAYALLAADRAVLVFLVEHESAPTAPRSAHARLRLPPWLDVVTAEDISGGVPCPISLETSEEGIILSGSIADGIAVIRVRCKSKEMAGARNLRGVAWRLGTRCHVPPGQRCGALW